MTRLSYADKLARENERQKVVRALKRAQKQARERALALLPPAPPPPCVFPPWLRQIASERPIVARWDSIGFAYDGHKIYIRMMGIQKHSVDPLVLAKNNKRAGRAKTARYMVVKVHAEWHVLDLSAKKRQTKTRNYETSKILARAPSRTAAHAIAERLRAEAAAA